MEKMKKEVSVGYRKVYSVSLLFYHFEIVSWHPTDIHLPQFILNILMGSSFSVHK